jgi:hypothetical protein
MLRGGMLRGQDKRSMTQDISSPDPNAKGTGGTTKWQAGGASKTRKPDRLACPFGDTCYLLPLQRRNFKKFKSGIFIKYL